MSEKTYLCILRNQTGNCEQPASPSDMEAMYAKYQSWQGKFADKIVSMGGKLGESGAVINQSGVKDGPFVETKEVVGGFMKIKADSLDEATAIIQESPMIMNPSVSIEIREIETP